ncbi:MAG: twin-arginine translocation signal domain-containing protein, partial [bacterium]
MKVVQTSSRRQFLHQSAVAAVGVASFVPSRVLGREGATAPSETIRLG